MIRKEPSVAPTPTKKKQKKILAINLYKEDNHSI